MADVTLYGFDGSTYVRTVRIVLALKGVDYEQVPVNVLEGEPRKPEHLARHPFGKVPVLDIDGARIRETEAITRYLDETRPEPPVTPQNAKDRARMTEAINLIMAYGYDALVGVAGYHLFPDLIGGKNEENRARSIEDSRKLLALLMDNRGESPWLAGDEAGLADFFLGPILFYVSLTPDAETVIVDERTKDWWGRIQGHEAFKASEPDLG